MSNVLIVYDVPSTVKCDPCRRLRRCGARINLSAWIVPEANVPWDYLNDIRAAGVSWHCVRFSTDEEAKIRDIAGQSLRDELRRIRAGMERSVELAASRLEMIDDLDAEAIEKHRKRRRAIVGRARRLLRHTQEALVVFGLLDDLESPLAALRDAIAAENDAYLAWTEAVACERGEVLV